MRPRLILRSSPVHGAGCYTLDAIPRRSTIIEYNGPHIPKADADLRYENRNVTYLFGLGGTRDVIDGFGTAMFLNHCCEPNCKTVETEAGRIYVRAIQDIAAGDELVYEYNLYDADEHDDQPCYCGKPKCRGTMFSPEEVKRRKRKGYKTALRNPA